MTYLLEVYRPVNRTGSPQGFWRQKHPVILPENYVDTCSAAVPPLSSGDPGGRNTPLYCLKIMWIPACCALSLSSSDPGGKKHRVYLLKIIWIPVSLFGLNLVSSRSPFSPTSLQEVDGAKVCKLTQLFTCVRPTTTLLLLSQCQPLLLEPILFGSPKCYSFTVDVILAI